MTAATFLVLVMAVTLVAVFLSRETLVLVNIVAWSAAGVIGAGVILNTLRTPRS